MPRLSQRGVEASARESRAGIRRSITENATLTMTGNVSNLKTGQSLTTVRPVESASPVLQPGEDSLSDTVLESIEQGIMVWSVDGICQYLNGRFFDLLELSDQDVSIGMTMRQHLERSVVRGELENDQIDGIEADFRARKSFRYERKVGANKIVAVTIRPIVNAGHVVSFTDVTESRNASDKLKEAMTKTARAETRANEALESIKTRQRNTDNLAELSDWLQSCKSIDELFEIVGQAGSSMFPGSSGQLFVYSNSRDVLDGAVSWGDEEIQRNIQPQDCWSLRRGRTFAFGDGIINYPCNHVHVEDTQGLKYLCMPIVAHGDTVGLLHIRLDNANGECDFDLLTEALAKRCAEQISIAIANVRLRDELHEQSTRDSLTGLYNRRYFQEACRAELQRHGLEKKPLSLVVLDADNFKSYNDRFGHDAGDKVLSTLGDVLRRLFADNEVILSRIGGEEFALLLPDTDTQRAEQRIKELLMAISTRELIFHNSVLPSLTVSAGIATYPEHGVELYDLLRNADLSMYDAKAAGKNCVCVHQPDSK